MMKGWYLLGLVVLLAGCQTAPPTDGATPGADTTPLAEGDPFGMSSSNDPFGNDPFASSGGGSGDPFGVASIDAPNRTTGGSGPFGGMGARENLIYFDFDSDQIRSDARPTLERHAQFLRENGQRTVTLEGHTDERGSREYNIALGERRGLAVRSYLVTLGVSAVQIQVVSFGEESPAQLGQDESAYSLNRRVELVY